MRVESNVRRNVQSPGPGRRNRRRRSVRSERRIVHFGAEKRKASAGGARSGGGAKNTDTLAERIREERDNNPYRRKLEDKDRQDRRSAQRDVQEEANGSRIAAGKSGRRQRYGGCKGTKENGAVRGNPSRYQHGRREERDCRIRARGRSADRIAPR